MSVLDRVRGFVFPEPALTRRILTLAAPVVFAMLTQTFVNITDTLMVGKLDPTVSVPGQAALGFSLPLLWSVGGFLSSISVGTQAMSARRAGAGAPEEAGRVLANSLLVAFTTGALASVAAYFMIPTAFSLLTADPAVQALGTEYAGWRMLGVLSMVATTSYKSFFDGIGKTHVHLAAAMVMNVLNVALNYVLIFGWWVFPAMGVGGAGLASLISTYVGLAVMIGWSLWPSLMRPFRVYRAVNVHLKTGWEIVKLSVPSGLATVFVMGGFLVFFKLIAMLDADAVLEALAATGVYGGDEAAAYRAWQDSWLDQGATPGAAAATDWTYMAIASRPSVYSAAAKIITDIFSVMFISSLAFGTATATLVSQSLGQGKPELAERYGWSSAKLGAWLLAVVAALVVAYPHATLDLLSDDPAVIDAGAPALRLLALFGPLVMMAFVWTQALFGAGNTKYVMYVELVLHFFCLVPGTWLFVFGLDLGFMGAWYAVGLYITALFVAMGWKFWEGKWKHIQV